MKTPSVPAPAPSGDAALQRCLDTVRECSGEGVTDLDLLEGLHALEELVCASRAAQARLTAAFVASRREQADRARDDDRAAGIGPRVADRRRREAEAAITAEVALARRTSPHRAARQIGLAHALSEMPNTQAAFDRGDLTEWKTTLIARETACLTREDRGVVDAELAARPGGATDLTDQQVEAAAKKIAYRLDPQSATRRASKAAEDRRVTVRPAPDTMTVLTALLPVKDGVACHAALTQDADTARAAGDERGRGQLMADLLVDRLTGRGPEAQSTIEVNLVMNEATLLDAGDEPAHLPGHGPVPAPLARNWVNDPAAKVFVRRLFTRPGDGALVAVESKRRLFPQSLRGFVMIRDGVCRTPGCGAPIRHLDHVVPAADGGPTSVINSQGLCERCNHARQARGWRSTVVGNTGDVVETTTPSGWTYISRVPPPVVAPTTASPPDDPLRDPPAWSVKRYDSWQTCLADLTLTA